MNTAAILEQFRFYRDAGQSLRDLYVEAVEHVYLPGGSTLYREGGEIMGVAFVGAGDVRVFKTGGSGREINLYHVRDGEVCLVSLMCVLLKRPAIASAMVEAPTEAVALRPEVFRERVRHDDSMRQFVFEAVAGRMLDVMTLIDEIAFRRVDVRLEALLLEQFSRQSTIDATHEWIAAELGTAREVVSRLLKDLERRGAIELRRGHIIVRDATKLG